MPRCIETFHRAKPKQPALLLVKFLADSLFRRGQAPANSRGVAPEVAGAAKADTATGAVAYPNVVLAAPNRQIVPALIARDGVIRYFVSIKPYSPQKIRMYL